MLIFEKMLVFLILMLVGLLLAKVKIIDHRGSKALSALVLYVANPALVIMASQTEHNIPNAELLTVVMIAVVLFVLLITMATVIPKLLRLNQTQANAYAMMTVFSNIGYMGIPLVSELYGSGAILYVSVFILIFNTVIYTYGIMVLQRGTVRPGQERFSLRKLVNPGVISSIVTVTFYLLKIYLPDVLTIPLGYLSNLTAPLGMMIIGVALAHVDIRSFFTDWKMLVFFAIKLLVVPILSCLALKQFIGGGDLLGICIVMMATPVGSMVVMLAQQYGGDDALLSRGVTLSTLLCIVTIPIVFAVVV